MLFSVKSPSGLRLPDHELQEAYDTYCALVKNPKPAEEIDAEGGWTLKTIQAFRRGVLPPAERISRILGFLEAEGGDYEYDSGVLNGLRLSMDAYEKTINSFPLTAAPRLSVPKAVAPEKRPEPEKKEKEPEPGKEEPKAEKPAQGKKASKEK